MNDMINISVTVDGKKIELTLEKGRELYHALGKIYGNEKKEDYSLQRKREDILERLKKESQFGPSNIYPPYDPYPPIWPIPMKIKIGVPDQSEESAFRQRFINT